MCVCVTYRVHELSHALVVAALLEVDARAGGVRQHVAAHLFCFCIVLCVRCVRLVSSWW